MTTTPPTTPTAAVELPAHRMPLGGTGWSVWREALLRSAGFPATGLDLLASPDCAAAADAALAGADGFAEAYRKAEEELAERLAGIAADPLFREAVTWQNPGALVALAGLPADPETAGHHRSRARNKRRHRQELVARYWQRYCGKNETVGFFGPVCWLELDPDGPAVRAEPGPALVRRRRVYLEDWALAGYAATVNADERLRPWLPVARPPHLHLAGDQVLLPAHPPTSLTATETAVLAACDGRSRAVDVARTLLAAGTAPALRKESDVLATLDRLSERGLVAWGIHLPIAPTAEATLHHHLTRLSTTDPSLTAGTQAGPDDTSSTSGEPGAEAALAAKEALAGFEALRAARDRVAEAAGDPVALRAALEALDAEFTARTGLAARRRAGEMYAGRALCYEETLRDLDVAVGGAVLDELAAPLAILLRAARWLTAAMADAYGTALNEIYDDLAGPAGVPFGDLWYLAQGPLFGSGTRPVDAVSAEFARRFGELFGLGGPDAAGARVTRSAGELAEDARRLFPDVAPGWRAARIHSPDLHLCAPSAAALAAGDWYAVLGEMHAAWATFDSAVFVTGHEEPDRLRAALAADLGPGQVRPLFPAGWPRHTGRVTHLLAAPDDVQLGYANAPGADPSRLLPVSALTVHRTSGTDPVSGRDEVRPGHADAAGADGVRSGLAVVPGADLVVVADDGRRWPLIEMFASLLAVHAVDGFKVVAAAPHTPRLTLDRLVVARETWRTTIGGTGLTAGRAAADRYLAARRLRAALGCPDRLFCKVGTETKPCYVDLTSPAYVSALATMLRAAAERHGPDVPVLFSELLPGPEDAWVPDAAGRRYFSELRLQLVDPLPARTTAGEGEAR